MDGVAMMERLLQIVDEAKQRLRKSEKEKKDMANKFKHREMELMLELEEYRDEEEDDDPLSTRCRRCGHDEEDPEFNQMLTHAHNHIDKLEAKREKFIERIEELEFKYAKLKKAHNALKKQLTAAGTMPTGADANTESDSGEENL